MKDFYTFHKFVLLIAIFAFLSQPIQTTAQINVEKPSNSSTIEQDIINQSSDNLLLDQNVELSDEEKAERKRKKAATQVLVFNESPTGDLKVLNGNDCDQASTVCSSSTISFTPTGPGNNDFLGVNSDGCLSGEHQSAWYYFEFQEDMPPGTAIDFVISPNNPSDDYDFAVWGPNVDCGSLGAPIRCSFAAPSGDTGLSPGSTDTSEGAGGDKFVSSIIANPGDGFFLMVDNWSQSTQGFDLNWSNAGAPFLDCNADPPCGMNVTTSNNLTICAGSIPQNMSGTATGGTGVITYEWTSIPPNAVTYLTNPNAPTTIVNIPATETNPSITYTLTATDATGCEGDDVVMITVTQGPPPQLDPIPPMCNEAQPVQLNNIQGGIPGSWSGPGVSGNIFNPANLNGSVTLTFTPNPGPCSSIGTLVVQITSGSPPVLDVFPPVCGGSGSILNLPPVQDGLNGTWSGPGVNGNQFDPTNLSGSVTLTFTPTGDCGGPSTTNITITPEDVPVLDNFDPVCETNASAIPLPNPQGPYFGTWSGDGVVGGNQFDPTGLNGSATITFTPDPGQCATSADATIILEAPAPVSIAPIGPLCEVQGIYQLDFQVGGVPGTWSGAGVDPNSNTFDPFGLSGSIELTFTPLPGECAETASTFVDIDSNIPINLDPINSPCGAVGNSIVLGNPQNGVFGTWSGNGVFNNEFDPTGMSGSVTLTFTPDASFCSEPASTVVTVLDPQPLQIPPFDDMCSGDAAMTLPPSINGVFGTWSGDGVINGQFDPFGISGNAIITFTPDPNFCTESDFTNIFVSPGQPVALDNFPPMCEGDGIINLPFQQDNVPGTWSGVGVNGNTFDPFGLSGVAELIFTPDPGQCAEGGSTFIEISPSIPLTLDTYGPFCDNVGVINLPFAPSGVNGIWSGPGVNGNSFDPSGQLGIVEITFTPDPGQCSEIASTFIEVNLGQAVNLDFIEPVCDGDLPVFLNPSQSGVTGTWSGDGVSGGLFDPSGQSGTVELIFVPDDGQCAEPASTFVSILPNQTLTLDTFDPLCTGGAPFSLPFLQNGLLGTWSGQGVFNGLFDPLGLEGNIELTFTPDPGQCADPASTFIEITPGEEVILDNFEPVCGSEIVDLPFAQNGITGIWSGDGVSGDQFDPFGLTGNIELTFTPDFGQCAEEASTFIEITPGEEVVLDNFEPICGSDNPIDLPFSQNGITGLWSGDGVNGTLFDPFGLNGNIELTFIPDAGQCAEEASTLIEITPGEEVSLDNFDPICGSDNPIDLPFIQSDVTGTWSGDGVNGTQFDPFGLNGNIELTFVPDGGQCAELNSTFITVDAAMTPQLEDFGPYCEEDATVSLSTNQNGIEGEWIGDGVFNNVFDPFGQGGTIELTFVPNEDQCAETASTFVDVEIAPFADLITNTNTCNTAAEGAIVDFESMIVEGETNGTWTDTNGSGVDLNDPSEVDFEGIAPDVYTFTYTVSSVNGNCPEQTYELSVLVENCACPSVATNSPEDLCNENGILDLASLQETTENGTWTIISTPNGTNPADLDGTIFDATNADAGTYEVIFTLNEQPFTGCPESSEQFIIVEDALPPALNDLDPMCPGDASITLPGIQDGITGIWSGDGIDGTEFNPADLEGTITLTFTPDAGQCASANTTTIDIVTSIEPALDELSDMCPTDAPISLEQVQSGVTGTWSGDGVSANQFNPADQSGTVVLTFTPDAGQCAVVATTSLDVVDGVEPVLDDLADICPTDTPISLEQVQDGITGTWSGDGVSANQFDPSNEMGTVELTFTPDDGQCAVEAMTTIEVVPGVAPNLTPLADICEQDTPISLATTQDGYTGTWSGDGVSANQFNPDNQTGTIELTFTPDDGQCAIIATTDIIITTPETPALEDLDALCQTDVALDLPTTQDGITGTWSGDGVSANQFVPNNQSGTIELTFTPDDGQCAEANTTNIEVGTPAEATLSNTSLNTCNTSLDGSSLDFAALIISGDANGMWIDTDATGVDLSDLSDVDFDGITASEQTYTFTYTTTSAVAPCENQSYEIEVLVENCVCPSVATNAPEVLCSIDGMTDLSALQVTDEEGVWTITNAPTGGNTATLDGTMFDASGADAGEYELTFTINNIQADCPTNSTQTLIVEPILIPNLTPLNPICSEAAALALPTTQDGLIGEWSGTGVTDNEFNPADLTGDIELTFTPTEGGCVQSNSTMINVTDEIIPALDDFEDLCDDDSAITLPTTQSNITGTWSGDGVSANQFTPTGQMGDVELTFTPDGGQCAGINTTTINVADCACPPLGTNPPAGPLCNENGSIDLSTLVAANSEPGTWTISSTPMGTNPATLNGTMFDAVGADEGNYEVTYTLDNPQINCPDSETQTITISAAIVPTLEAIADLCETDNAISLSTNQNGIIGNWSGAGVNNNQFIPSMQDGTSTLTFTPDAGQCAVANTTDVVVGVQPFATLDNTSLNTCNTSADGSILNFAALISAGDTNGTWTDTDGTGVDLSDPSSIDFDGITESTDTYTFTYTTTSAVAPCVNQSYEIEVLVENCLCPSVATTGPDPICNDGGMIDLSSLVTTTEAGTWTISNTTADNPATLNGTILDVNGTSAGEYTLVYTINNVTGDCPESSSQTLIVNDAPSAGTGNAMTSCNDEAALIDLTTLLSGQDGSGTWSLSTNSETPNTATFDSNAGTFNPFEQTVGNFEFVYTVTGLAPCPEDMTTVMVTIEDCECPSVALGTVEAQCNDNALVDLNPVQLTSESGTWAIISAPNGSNPATLNGTIFDGTNADAGTYTLEFTLDNPQLDCPNANSITIVVDEMLSAGVANTPITICNSENTNIGLADEINDEDTGGTWTETSATTSTGSAFDFNNATFNPFNQAAGTYTFTYMVGSSASACPPAETTVTIIVQAAPVANAGNDQIMGCAESVSLNGSASIGSSYEWTNEVGDVVGTTPIITVSEHGIYTLTVSNGLCEETDIVIIDPPGAPMELTYNVVEPGCTGVTGSVSLSIQGGTGPYTYSINGISSSSGQFSNLQPGTYDFVVTDAMGCTTTTDALVPEPITVTLDLGPDQEIDLGDEVDILALTNIAPQQIADITWSQDSICINDCIEAVVTPTETVTVSATIVDENGCSATDEIQIFVDRRPDIYPPNAFSPDKDGYNDYFMIYTGKNVAEFTSLQVFNRWGELVFYNDELTLNQTDMGWNGTFKGEDLNPDVFVWWAEFKLMDGSTILKKGDISLVK